MVKFRSHLFVLYSGTVSLAHNQKSINLYLTQPVHIRKILYRIKYIKAMLKKQKV